MGVVVAAKDFSPSRAASGRSLVLQSLLAVVAIVVLAGAIIIMRGVLLDPLDERRKAAAAEAEAEAPAREAA